MYEWKATNAIYLDDEVAGKGRQFKCRFLVPGLVKYDFGVCLLTKENADKFIQEFVGCPVIINHQDLTDKNAKEKSVGNIFSVWFDEKDGYYWCNGIITDKHAIELIDKGYSVSCQYTITDYSDNTTGALHNGNSYDKLIEDGKPEHLAIVNNPRYEGAIIAVNAILAQNEDKWITVHPNGEENKGRHLLLKDGESVEDAMHRNGWYKKRQAKEDNKEENFEKETKTTKKDENRHQNVRDLEDKAYKEFKTMYDNYIDKDGMEGWGGIPASRFDKAKEQFNKKYKDAFEKLGSDRFVSFEDFAKREQKQSDKEEKGEPKKYTYTLTKKEVGNDAWLGGMADTGNYYTNGSFAIDKRYLDIKGQEPKKVPDIDNSVKKILTETAKKKQKEETYRKIKDFEEGTITKENGGKVNVVKYSYYDDKNDYTENVYIDKKFNDLFKNFELKFGGPFSPVYAYDGEDLIGTVMPISPGRAFEYLAKNSFVSQFKDTLYTALAEGIVNRLGELIASNEDKWITIHPHGDDSEDYRRLKLKDGESPEEAMHRMGWYEKRKAKDEKQKKLVEQKIKELQEKAKKVGGENTVLGKKYLAQIKELQKGNIGVKEDETETAKGNGLLPSYANDFFRKKEEYEKARQEYHELLAEYQEKAKNDKKFKEYQDRIDKIYAEMNKINRYNEDFQKLINEKNKIIDEKHAYEKEFYKEVYAAQEKASSLNTMTDKKEVIKKMSGDIKKQIGKISSRNNELVNKLNKIDSSENEKLKKQDDEFNTKQNEIVKQMRELPYDDPKRAELRAQFAECATKRGEIIKKQRELQYKTALEVSKLLQVKNGIKLNTKNSPAMQEITDKLKECLDGVIPSTNFNNAEMTVRKHEGRAFHSGSTINISAKDKIETAIHETMHHLEEHSEHVLMNSLAFAASRTEGEKQASLKRLTGLSYKANEVCKKDNFFNPYCGKLYDVFGGRDKSFENSVASEIMSMGVQELFTNPKEFAANDREYFDFVVANLRGEVWN